MYPGPHFETDFRVVAVSGDCELNFRLSESETFIPF